VVKSQVFQDKMRYLILEERRDRKGTAKLDCVAYSLLSKLGHSQSEMRGLRQTSTNIYSS
jgi:hypothetical protein